MIYHFLLLLWSSSVDAQPSPQQYRISIVIFAENDFHDTLHSVRNAFLEVFQSTSFQIGDYTIVAEYIDGGTLDTKETSNRLQITDDIVCDHIVNGSIASVIFATSVHRTTKWQYLSLVSSVVSSLSFYKLPVIGVMVRDSEFSKKKIYPTFVRPTPAYSDEAYVFMHLLRRLNYRQVVVLIVRGDGNAEEFVESFEERRIDNKIHVQQYIELDLGYDLENKIKEYFEEVTSNIIILFATKSDAQQIFDAAQHLTGKGKVWIVNEPASKANNVPDGVLSVRLNQTPLSALRNSFTMLRNGLQYLKTTNDTVIPPLDCAKDGIDPAWTEKHAAELLKEICNTRTSKIELNAECERISVEYDIVNFHEGIREVGALNGNQLRLNEDTIYWSGGTLKPLEISLPKHLRAVTMHDPPFIYTSPIIHLQECYNLGSVKVAISGKDFINVPGPWYPCPKYSANYTRHYCCAGYAIDLLSNLSLPEPNSTMDTSFTFSLHLNESYGSVLLADQGNGYTLTGAIGELDSDMADLAIGGMSINPERERYIDFSEPWLYHGIRILEKTIPRDSPMQSFLQPLKSSLWTALFISVLLVGLSIFLLDRKSPFDRFYNVNNPNIPPAHLLAVSEEKDDERVSFGESMWFVWGVLLNSGVSEKTPRSCSARVLGIVWCGFCMIMVASYTANLAAYLVLDQPEKGLTGVTDPRLRNPSANFTFCTVLHSNVYQYFKRHVELSTMFRKMESHNVLKVDDAIQALLNGTLDAFIWDSSRLEFESARHCQLRTRGALFGRSAYGVGLQKNSPWTPHITMAILRMSESGEMEKLDAKWIDNSGSKCDVDVHKSPARLGLTNMKDVFILVTGGVAAGAILSLIEVTYGRRKAANGRKRALAIRYACKWRKCVIRSNPRHYYNLQRPVMRMGFAGIQPCSLQDVKSRENERTRSPRRNSVGESTSLRNDVFVPNLNFNRAPVTLFCSRCRNLIQTDVRRRRGVFASVCSLILCILFLWPLAPLPCFLNIFSDFDHLCPVCSHRVGRYRRGWGPRFYV